MADEPIASLGGMSPLQRARKPAIDRLAKMGRSGLLHSIPEGFKPGSEIANLAILGYDVAAVFEGRGSLEAASMGIEIGADEVAMRCNLICIEEGRIKNHSAGHISTEEARELITFLQKTLGNYDLNFFAGVSYRHLLKLRGGDKHLDCTAPHDEIGMPFRKVMIKALQSSAQNTADILNDLILRSQNILPEHPVNVRRVAAGKDPANSIWPWSPGGRPDMPTLLEKYGLRNGAVISAVDLIKGTGIYAGLQSIDVEGATGLYNTNYEGKTAAALEALRKTDFVFLHIEASDEAGHEGDAELKVRTIEYLDSRVVGPVMEATATWSEPVTIALLPDHWTPCRLKTHVANPVPFVICGPNIVPDAVERYDEEAARDGGYDELFSSEQFMEELILKNK
jgi:2,3-bisphosphoglycerate-independent phosphoglycerate mutase